MKKLQFAIMVAMLISGLFFSQASAAPSPSVSASGSCGSTYTVLAGDTLSSIAAKCGVTVTGILSNNPSITNPNLIYRGQVLNLAGITTTTTTGVTGGGNCSNPYTVVGGDYLASIAARCGTTVADILYNNPSITNANLIYVGQVIKLTGSGPTTTTGTTYSGDAYITISATSADPGDTIVVKAYDFPKNASVDFRIYKKGSSTYTEVYDGTTDSSGYAKKTVTIPSSVSEGQYYVVKVMTTDRVDGVTITSPSILITSGSGGNGDASVTLSKYSVTPGGTLEVFANDFPANQDIDFCVRKSGSSTCAVVYDGKTDSDGYDSTTVTFPSSAVAGQTWVVQVKTTNLVSEVKAVSSKVTIK